mgnify:CR=1 FL=1
MCPFIDQGDPRCAAHWTLVNVFETFRHCAGSYTSCPVYRQLVGRTPTGELPIEHEQAAPLAAG